MSAFGLQIKKARFHLPYITKDITRLRCKKEKMHAKAKSSGRNSLWETFKQFRKDVSKAIIKSHTQ